MIQGSILFFPRRPVHPLKRLRSLLPAIAEGQLPTPTQEMLSLAKKALDGMATNQEEDIDSWAERIGRGIMTDGDRTETAIRGADGKRLTYRTPREP